MRFTLLSIRNWIWNFSQWIQPEISRLTIDCMAAVFANRGRHDASCIDQSLSNIQMWLHARKAEGTVTKARRKSNLFGNSSNYLFVCFILLCVNLVSAHAIACNWCCFVVDRYRNLHFITRSHTRAHCPAFHVSSCSPSKCQRCVNWFRWSVVSRTTRLWHSDHFHFCHPQGANFPSTA